MKRNLNEELKRQIDLMTYSINKKSIINESINPGPITGFGGLIMKKLANNLDSMWKTQMEQAFSKLRELPSFKVLEGKGIKTFEDWIEDLRNINNAPRGQVLHKLTDSEYTAMGKDLFKTFIKNPSFKPVADDVFEEYKKFVGRNNGDIAELEQLERYANNGFRENFELLKAQVQSRKPPSFDEDMITYLETKMPVQTTKEFFDDSFAKGLGQAFVDLVSPVLKIFIKENSEVELRDLMNEYIQIVRELSDDMAGDISLNYADYIRRLEELSLKISQHEKNMVKRAWDKISGMIPDNVKKELTDENGILNYSKFQEWVRYFDSLKTTSPLLPPKAFTSKIDALKSMFTKLKNVRDTGGLELSKKALMWKRTMNFLERFGRFLYRGTFRLGDEIQLNKTIMGESRYAGYQVGELLISKLFVMPFVVSFLQTWGDYAERNEAIPDWMPVHGIFDGDNFTGKEERIMNFGDIWTNFISNVGEKYRTFWAPMGLSKRLNNISWMFTEAFSPGLAAALAVIMQGKVGGPPKPEDNQITKQKVNDIIQKIQINSREIKDTLVDYGLEGIVGDTSNYDFPNLESLDIKFQN